jgi:hypothetical protein
MGKEIYLNGTTYRVHMPVTPPRGKGYTYLLRQLEPGDAIGLPCTIHTASTIANRVLGKGNYRSWTNTDPDVEGRTIIKRNE